MILLSRSVAISESPKSLVTSSRQVGPDLGGDIMEDVPSISYMAIIVATVYSFIVGSLWYSPALFGKRWQELVKLDPESMDKSDMYKAMAVGIIASFFIAYTLAHLIQYFEQGGVWTGVHAGAGLWFGVILMYAWMTKTYEKRPTGLLLINVGYQFLSVTGMAIIIALLQR
jgi:hypothetical protein